MTLNRSVIVQLIGTSALIVHVGQATLCGRQQQTTMAVTTNAPQLCILLRQSSSIAAAANANQVRVSRSWPCNISLPTCNAEDPGVFANVMTTRYIRTMHAESHNGKYLSSDSGNCDCTPETRFHGLALCCRLSRLPAALVAAIEDVAAAQRSQQRCCRRSCANGVLAAKCRVSSAVVQHQPSPLWRLCKHSVLSCAGTISDSSL